MIILKRKQFSKYDETDNLKRMKDSDILAEEKKQVFDPSSVSNIAKSSIKGALIGGSLGAGVAGLSGAALGSGITKNALRKGLGWGGILGGIYFANKAYEHAKQKAEDIDWYNRRLEYAQYQAKRREAKDWKRNMTQRDGYSY